MSRVDKNTMDRANCMPHTPRGTGGAVLGLLDAQVWRGMRGLVIGLLLVLAGSLTSGCGRRTEQYIPEPEIAESAVRRALSAWQAGEPAGQISDTQPAIFVTDTNRKPKQRLTNFDILGETPGHSGRTYVVELALDSPAEKIKAEYIVVGIDPLWVFRREDYELLMHWDHYMPEQTSDAKAADEQGEAPSAGAG